MPVSRYKPNFQMTWRLGRAAFGGLHAPPMRISCAPKAAWLISKSKRSAAFARRSVCRSLAGGLPSPAASAQHLGHHILHGI